MKITTRRRWCVGNPEVAVELHRAVGGSDVQFDPHVQVCIEGHKTTLMLEDVNELLEALETARKMLGGGYAE